MSAKRKLTELEIGRIVELGDRGKSVGYIAYDTKLHPSAILYQLLRAGICPFKKQNTIAVHKSDSRNRRFSEEEDVRLLALSRGGDGAAAIAKKLGRAYTSVRLRLMLLEARAERDAA